MKKWFASLVREAFRALEAPQICRQCDEAAASGNAGFRLMEFLGLADLAT